MRSDVQSMAQGARPPPRPWRLGVGHQQVQAYYDDRAQRNWSTVRTSHRQAVAEHEGGEARFADVVQRASSANGTSMLVRANSAANGALSVASGVTGGGVYAGPTTGSLPRTDSNLTQFGGIPRCSICLAEPCDAGERAVTTTPCGHTFCVQCLNEAIAVKPQCPNCRGALASPEHLASMSPQQQATLEKEADYYASEHQRHRALEIAEALMIQQRGLLPIKLYSIFGILVVLVVCILFIMVVEEVEVSRSATSCMEVFNSIRTTGDDSRSSTSSNSSLVTSNGATEECLCQECEQVLELTCVRGVEAEVAQEWADLLYFIHVSVAHCFCLAHLPMHAYSGLLLPSKFGSCMGFCKAPKWGV